jgi:hypothetical protein
VNSDRDGTISRAYPSARWHDGARRVRCARPGLHRFQHFRVEHQALDLRLARGQTERLDAGVEPLVELVDREVQAPPHEPAHRRPKDAVEEADERENDEKDDEPERKGDGCIHSVASLPFSRRFNSKLVQCRTDCNPAKPRTKAIA